jgi:DNA ligase (NAD+)
MQRMKELVDKLNRYAKEYYELDNPTISDKEYDQLYDELVKLEESTGIILPNSPTHRVGGKPLDRFKRHTHRQRLYSLDKAKDQQGLKSYFQRVKKILGFVPEMTLEHKFDGLTLSLSYENGELVTAATRGDGIVGEDVTPQVRTIRSVPLVIPYKGFIEIQGEAIMRLSVFEEYNKTAKEPLKNARNAAAGAIRNLDPKVTAERKLDFMAYNVGYSDKEFLSQQDVRKFLIENGYQTDDMFKIINDTKTLFEMLNALEENRPNLDFLIDGAVLKIDKFEYRKILGFTEKFPRWAIAYKFMAEETTTILKDVIWQVSRTGKINPLAVLEPVELLGATVKRATLNNILDIQRKDIKINSRVFIRRSNDVIPEIMGVSEHYPHSVDILSPAKCPSCQSEVKQIGAFLYCENIDSCAPRIISAITHFASKPCIDIEGLSEKTVEQLYNELKINSIDKLYDLKKEQLLTLEGFKDKRADNLLTNIEKSKNTTLDRFIFALGINTIGKKAAYQLAKRFKTLDALIKATKEEIVEIDDFGDIMAENVVNFFSDEKNVDLINSLLGKGVRFETKEEVTDGVFAGRVVVLTGSLMNYKRSQAAKIIQSQGGKVNDSVSKSVNLVIAGQDAGSKLKKAKKLGIEIQDEDWFIRQIENIKTEDTK